MSLLEKLQQPVPTGISLIDKLRGLIPHQGQPIAQPGSQLENVLSSSRTLGEQVREKVGQPLTRTLPIAKRAGDILMSPGTELLSPRLKKAGVSPFVAGAVGLGVDILAPGPGEVKTGSKLLKEKGAFKDLTQEAKKYKSAEEFVRGTRSERGLSSMKTLLDEGDNLEKSIAGKKGTMQGIRVEFLSPEEGRMARVKILEDNAEYGVKKGDIQQYSLPDAVSGKLKINIEKNDVISKLTDARDNGKFDFKLSSDKTQIEVNANGIKFKIPRGDARMADAQQSKVRQYINALIKREESKSQLTDIWKEAHKK